MKQAVTMPVLSDTMETGRLVRWNKAVGDPVKKGEAIAEVETDKAILDVEAFADGFLAGPLAPVDEDIPVRQTIAYIVDSQEAAKTEATDARTTSATETPAPTPKADSAAESTNPASPRAAPAKAAAEVATDVQNGTPAAISTPVATKKE
jgi:pyruvate dehydrogenase E2 component (dihydrolipoamide acetyltransferase)